MYEKHQQIHPAVRYEDTVDGGLKRQGTVLCLVNKLLKTNGTVFDVAGIGADFISEMQDGNNILGAAILAAGHFATTAVINMVLSATFIWLGIPSIFIIPSTIIISSIII